MFFVLEDHFKEIQYRCLYIVFFFLLQSSLLFFSLPDLFDFFTSTLHKNFIFTSPSESFRTQIELCLLLSLYMTLPYALFQFWSFFRPGCHFFEIHFLRILFSIFFFGYFFAFFLSSFFIFPVAIKFFMSFEIHQPHYQIEFLPKMSHLISFYFRILWTCFFFFQTPLFPFLAFQFGFLQSHHLVSFRRYFLFLAFLLAALFSPPDLASQFFIALPMVFCYELQIFFFFFLEKKMALFSRKNAIFQLHTDHSFF
uniref:Sec-independent protein translocase component TatC n=1 Tax=Andalucia godoyi TaxID=505711 RepID=M4QCS0_ANDGO|nr:Sec-independent protein translocase component TatC [Andalucia godoyi]AGH23995.1 Sec-independent protein translocase component TatC [Andalucia godoyi]